MEMNFIALFVAAIITLFVGFIWYHPKVFGTIWMKEAGLTEDQLKTGNMLKFSASLTSFLYLLLLSK